MEVGNFRMETQRNSLDKPAEGAHMGARGCLRDNDRLTTALDPEEEIFLSSRVIATPALLSIGFSH